MPQVSKVGDGHGGSEDYATLNLWWAAEVGNDYGDVIEARCLGDCGSNLSISSASVNGAKIYTLGVTYDGSNESSLATFDRLYVQAGAATSSAPIEIYDMYFDNSGQSFTSPLRVGSDYCSIDRVRIHNIAANVQTFIVTDPTSNSHIYNAVVDGGTDVLGLGFNDGIEYDYILFFGGADKGLEGAGNTAYAIKNSLGFNNTGDDIEGIITIVNCATEDSTGTYTGYTSAELVNFAGGDYRTKASSALATMGTGGTYIGAFLEESAEDIPLTLTDISIQSTIDVIDASRFTSLSLSDISVQPTVDVLALIEDVLLTFNDVSVQATSDALNINRFTNLSVKDISIQPTADTLSINRFTQVTFSDVTVPVTVDQVDIDRFTSLLVNDITIQSEVDVLTLAVGVMLNVKDVTIQPTVDVFGINKSTTLNVSDITVQSTVDEVSITRYTDLQFNDITIQPTVDILSLITQFMPDLDDNIKLINQTIRYKMMNNTQQYRIKKNAID